MQIVLAKVEQDVVIAKEGQIDLGRPHKLKTVPKPVSLMWKNDGGEADMVKANAYAAREGYRVFTYNGERNPLERARQDILA